MHKRQRSTTFSRERSGLHWALVPNPSKQYNINVDQSMGSRTREENRSLRDRRERSRSPNRESKSTRVREVSDKGTRKNLFRKSYFDSILDSPARSSRERHSRSCSREVDIVRNERRGRVRISESKSPDPKAKERRTPPPPSPD